MKEYKIRLIFGKKSTYSKENVEHIYIFNFEDSIENYNNGWILIPQPELYVVRAWAKAVQVPNPEDTFAQSILAQ